MLEASLLQRQSLRVVELEIGEVRRGQADGARIKTCAQQDDLPAPRRNLLLEHVVVVPCPDLDQLLDERKADRGPRGGLPALVVEKQIDDGVAIERSRRIVLFRA